MCVCVCVLQNPEKKDYSVEILRVADIKLNFPTVIRDLIYSIRSLLSHTLDESPVLLDPDKHTDPTVEGSQCYVSNTLPLTSRLV